MGECSSVGIAGFTRGVASLTSARNFECGALIVPPLVN
jgi:hypothetical protein